jgi:hypothetical protein
MYGVLFKVCWILKVLDWMYGVWFKVWFKVLFKVLFKVWFKKFAAQNFH